MHIGVDISPTQLVCVKTRGQESDYEVLATSVVPLPGGAEPGTPEFVSLLHRTLSRLCAPGERPMLWAASQTARVNIQYVTIPKVSSRQVDNAVFWTAKKDMLIFIIPTILKEKPIAPVPPVAGPAVPPQDMALSPTASQTDSQ